MTLVNMICEAAMKKRSLVLLLNGGVADVWKEGERYVMQHDAMGVKLYADECKSKFASGNDCLEFEAADGTRWELQLVEKLNVFAV